MGRFYVVKKHQRFQIVVNSLWVAPKRGLYWAQQISYLISSDINGEVLNFASININIYCLPIQSLTKRLHFLAHFITITYMGMELWMALERTGPFLFNLCIFRHIEYLQWYRSYRWKDLLYIKLYWLFQKPHFFRRS